MPPIELLFRLKNESYFQITQTYNQPQFRETIQRRAYNLEALVGNIGGYAGLFLGYALVQLPDFFLSIYTYLRRRVCNQGRQNQITVA